jgi:hypothetical protein
MERRYWKTGEFPVLPLVALVGGWAMLTLNEVVADLLAEGWRHVEVANETTYGSPEDNFRFWYVRAESGPEWKVVYAVDGKTTQESGDVQADQAWPPTVQEILDRVLA